MSLRKFCAIVNVFHHYSATGIVESWRCLNKIKTLRPVFEKEPSVECMKDNKTQLFLSLDDPSSLCDLGGGHTAPDSMDLVIFLGNEM